MRILPSVVFESRHNKEKNGMATLEKLSEYIDNEFSLNYWADDAIDYANELVSTLSDNEWHRLKQTWHSKSVAWQIRCADAVFGVDSKHAIDLLIKMLNSVEVEVALAAAEGLEASDWNPDPDSIPVLEKLVNKLETDERSTVDTLIERGSHIVQ